MKIDEHALAGYMAGELNDSDRASVTAALLRDRDAREWLSMATEALAAARTSQSEGIMSRFVSRMEPSRPGVQREDRRAIPNPFRARRVG
jgi:hypothetical protein